MRQRAAVFSGRLPWRSSASSIGPTASVLDTTTMPISEMGAAPSECSAHAGGAAGGVARDGRGPPKPLFEEVIGEIFEPWLDPQLYSPTTNTNASARRIFVAKTSICAGASAGAYLSDYPVAVVLLAAPFVLKLGQSGPSQCGFRLSSVPRRKCCPS